MTKNAKFEYKNLKCIGCGIIFDSKSRNKRQKYCCLKCRFENIDWKSEMLRRMRISKMTKGIKRPPFTEEHKKKIGDFWRGKKQSREFVEKRMKNLRGEKHWAYGKKRPEVKSWLHTKEIGQKISKAQEGKIKLKIRKKNNGNWRGGVTSINEQIRKSVEYKKWRKNVFERDNYTCQQCNQVGGKLNADHIKPFSLFPELRFEINNGRTLCIQCHRKIGWNIMKEANPRKDKKAIRIVFPAGQTVTFCPEEEIDK